MRANIRPRRVPLKRALLVWAAVTGAWTLGELLLGGAFWALWAIHR